jgi:hypothetical protein
MKKKTPTIRKPSEFTDAFGQPVKVGDRVVGHGVNGGLAGRVTALDRDRTHKPFVVIADNGDLMYFAREWTRKVTAAIDPKNQAAGDEGRA